MHLTPGTRLGPYEILTKLGEGGMGEVYRARDTSLGRDVAIKVLPAQVASDPERLARFEREARLLASLSHTNIAQIYGLEKTAGGAAALVMELAAGDDLSAHISRGPLSLQDALPIATQIAHALEAAHERGIIHRDLKPANIKVTADGGVKVLDFGLAKALDPNAGNGTADAMNSPTLTAQATAAGVILGTAAYMSPEQARGRDADKRADVWAFGAVLFEILTGTRLFQGETISDTLAAVLRQDIPWSALPSRTPAEVVRLIRRCLERDRKHRLHDIADARIVLEEVARGSTGHTPEVSGSPRPARIAFLAGVGGGILVAAIGISIWAWSRPPNAAGQIGSSGQVAFTLRLPDKINLLDSGTRQPITISPDGRTVAFAGTDGDQSAIYTRRLDQLDAIKVAGTAGGNGPFFSHDGRSIGFIDDLRIMKVPTAGGSPVEVCDVPTGVRGALWLADDTIVFSTPTGGVMRVPAQGGTATALTRLDPTKHEKTHRTVVALPGGKAIVFVIGSNEIATYDQGRIVTMRLDTNEIRDVAKGYAPVFSSTGHLLYVRDGTVFARTLDAATLKVGDSEVQVLKDIGALPSWGTANFDVSADGTLTYTTGGDRNRVGSLSWIDRLGTIQPTGLEIRRWENPEFSPDGRRVALQLVGANNTIWAYDIERGATQRITSRYDAEDLAWSPNGREITYWSGADLRSVTSDGTERDRVLIAAEVAGNRSIQPVRWSDDEKTLVVNIYTPGKAPDVGLYSPDKGLTSLLDTRFDEEAADLSPDGRWLLYYYSDQPQRRQLYIRDMTTGASEPVTNTNIGWATWTRRGTELQHASDDGVFAQSFTPGPRLVFGKPERLVPKLTLERMDDLSRPSIRSDGLRTAVIDHKPRPPITEIRVVLNWAQDLARHWR